MSKDEGLPPLEWLEKRIEYTIESKGRVHGYYEEYKQSNASPSGIYSWLDYLVGELLQTYRLLKMQQEDIDQTRETNKLRWRELIGLDKDSTGEQVDARLKEIRDFFIEMDRIGQGKKGKGTVGPSP